MFAKALITGSVQGGVAPVDVEYLVIAGGGGGAVLHSGGGGAGGYRSSVIGESSGGGASAESVLSAVLNTAYTVTVGAGGAGVPAGYGSDANKGNNSVLHTITSIGGGGGSIDALEPAGTIDGGSGGGGGAGPTAPGGLGTTGQGYAGGNGSNAGGSTYHGGGGGGAAEVGGNSTTSVKAGDGGDGVESYITGSAVYRAGGGGGSSYITSHAGGTGGLGGGGNGGNGVAGASGTANTGGGGGAGGGPSGASGDGGSGVVIIRIPSTHYAVFSAGVVYNYYPLDGLNVYEVTGAGVSDTVTFQAYEAVPVTIDESLRFNDDDSANLTRTPSVAGDRKTWTWSAWVKLGNVSFNRVLYNGRLPSANSTGTAIRLNISNQVEVFHYVFGAFSWQITTSAILRDPSAWYHIVVAFDSTTEITQRVRIYVNGVRQVSGGSAPALNFDTYVNDTQQQLLGAESFGGAAPGAFFDGYLSDVYLIDGEALDPSRFGRADENGIWQPIAYTGAYGTNGFHLEFADNSTAAALGTDTSGNGNDWTPSGITTDDQMADTPSVNYCTLNPLDKGTVQVLTDGNLRATSTSTNWQHTRATFAMPSGKWYWEADGITDATYIMIGITNQDATVGEYPGQNADGYGYYSSNGNLYNNGNTLYGATYGVGDTVGVSFDADIGELIFYKNGVSLGVAATGLTNDLWFPAIGVHTTTGAEFNFGQRPFTYTPPTGFQALNSANLPTPTITDGKEHFQPVLYTGNGTSQSVRGLEFQPDFVWVKQRDTARSHQLYDAVRGATKRIKSDSTNAEDTRTDGLTAFLANGFTVSNGIAINNLNAPYVAWNWNAGGSTVTNTDGTITSQVRANTDAGISIVSWASSSYSDTIGHGLSQAPDMIIAKERDGARSWFVYHSSLGNSYYLLLDGTTAAATPNSGRIEVSGSDTFICGTDFTNQIAYCFHSVEGFSKLGTYAGNGSADGPFVYTGFRPAFVMVKKTNATQSWSMMDNKRTAKYNDVDGRVFADLSDAEVTGAACDFLSNGFKLRGTQSSSNGSGDSYIYMAFAENPFKTARAR